MRHCIDEIDIWNVLDEDEMEQGRDKINSKNVHDMILGVKVWDWVRLRNEIVWDRREQQHVYV